MKQRKSGRQRRRPLIGRTVSARVGSSTDHHVKENGSTCVCVGGGHLMRRGDVGDEILTPAVIIHADWPDQSSRSTTATTATTTATATTTTTTAMTTTAAAAAALEGARPASDWPPSWVGQEPMRQGFLGFRRCRRCRASVAGCRQGAVSLSQQSSFFFPFSTLFLVTPVGILGIPGIL